MPEPAARDFVLARVGRDFARDPYPTYRRLRELDLEPTIEAGVSTIDGLIDAIVDAEKVSG